MGWNALCFPDCVATILSWTVLFRRKEKMVRVKVGCLRCWKDQYLSLSYHSTSKGSQFLRVCCCCSAAEGGEDPHALPWSWVLDLERTCALLIGLCIGSMLHGPPIMPCETQSSAWLSSVLFSNGLHLSVKQLGKLWGLLKICKLCLFYIGDGLHLPCSKDAA